MKTIIFAILVMGSTAYGQIDSSNTDLLVTISCVIDEVDGTADGSDLDQHGSVFQIKCGYFNWGNSERMPEYIVFRLFGISPEQATIALNHYLASGKKCIRSDVVAQIVENHNNGTAPLIDGRVIEFDLSTQKKRNDFERDFTENAKRND